MHRTERMIMLSKIAEKDSEDAGYRIRAIDVLNKMDGDYVQKVEVTTPDDGTLKEMEKYFASKKRNTWPALWKTLFGGALGGIYGFNAAA